MNKNIKILLILLICSAFILIGQILYKLNRHINFANDVIDDFNTKGNTEITGQDLWVSESNYKLLADWNSKIDSTRLPTCDNDPQHDMCRKDGDKIYINGYLLAEADINTFVVLNEYFAKDKNNFYSFIPSGLDSVPGSSTIIDAATYNLLPGGNSYAKDKNHYYWQDIIINPDSNFVAIDNKYAKDSKNVYMGSRILDGADPATFASLHDKLGWYAKDSTHVYIMGDVDPKLDPLTFAIINQTHYKDSNNVYYLSGSDPVELIVGAEPKTFVAIDDWYGKDAYRVYFAADVLPESDPNTFSVIPNGSYATDSKHVYWRWRLVPKADPITFIGLDWDYGKDKNYVFYIDEIVLGADPATFKSYDDELSCGTNCFYNGEDKNHKYMLGKIVK